MNAESLVKFAINDSGCFLRSLDSLATALFWECFSAAAAAVVLMVAGLCNHELSRRYFQ